VNDNDVVLETGAGVSAFKNSKHVFDIYEDDEMIEIYSLELITINLCIRASGADVTSVMFMCLTGAWQTFSF